MERGMKWGVRQVSWERLTTEAIKRMKFARGPALPEVSTSAGLISDLHHYHSPVFPSPSSARTCGGRDVTLMSARVLSVDKLPTILWRDKLSRLIISLSLTVRQLIKAPQGSIISSFSSPALSAGGVRPLMGGGGILEMTSWAWADRRGQEAKLVQTRIHDWACTNVSVAKTKAREKEARQRKQGEKMTVKAAETALLSQRIVVP